MRLEIVGPAAVSSVRGDLRGGMRVTAIRPSSPAATAALRTGDILIGLHHWETLTADSVPFILGFAQGAALRSLRFVVLRDKQIITGEFVLGSP